MVGGFGHIGTALAEDLGAAGYAVTCLGRAQTQDTAGLSASLKDVDVLIHAAGDARPSRAAQDAAQPQLCQQLIAAAAQSPCRHFIYLSSILAIAGWSHPHPVGDDNARPLTDAYSSAKRSAEDWLLANTPDNIQLHVIRIPAVYGPDQPGNVASLARLVQRGLPVPVSRNNRRSLLYIGNLTALCARLIELPVAQTLLHAADPEPVSTAQLVGWIAANLGRTPRMVVLEQPWLQQVPGLKQMTQRLLGSLELDCSEAYLPGSLRGGISTEEGIARSVKTPSA